MARSFPALPVLAGLLAVAGCGKFDRAERPAWRDQAEESCLARHLVEPSDAIQASHAIDGPGICGLNHPFKVYALAGGTVRLNTASILACPMIPVLDAWITGTVQPDAMARFGEPVVQINTMGTYSCRGINNMSGAKLSEHAFGNAMDVGGFVLASGRVVSVVRGWHSDDPQEVGFLQDSHAGACSGFTTVLGPGSNAFHYDHIHVDLAMHGNTSRGPRRVCKPVPAQQIPGPQQDTLPDPPPLEEEMDIAGAPAPAAAYAGAAAPRFVASAPAATAFRPPAPLAPRPVSIAAARPGPQVTAAPLPGRDEAAGGSPGRVPEGSPADWDLTSLITRSTR